MASLGSWPIALTLGESERSSPQSRQPHSKEHYLLALVSQS